jgi:hypothetical protein
MAISVITALTEIGRNRIADMTVSGRGFQIVAFVVGSGGADPSDPTVPLSPDPTVTSLPSQTFGPKLLTLPTPGQPFTGVLSTPFCPLFTGLLDFPDANGSISNYGLIGQITSSLVPNDPLIGTQFLFAYGTTPLKVKTDGDQFQINFTLQT